MKRFLPFLLFSAVAAFASCGGDDTTPTVKVTSITLNQTTATLAPEGTLQLNTTSILPSDAADKTVTWSSNPTSVATVDSEGLVTVLSTAANGDTATITATANDGSGVTASCTISVIVVPSEGVLIDGVIWAKYNVDAVGSFAAAPEATGKFYQWNRNVAWAATGTVTDWDTTTPPGETWAAANDPCPAGWRVPTESEQETLLVSDRVDRLQTTQNGVTGHKFTDKATSDFIFFPMTGYRSDIDGRVIGTNAAVYWASSSYSPSAAWRLILTNSDAAAMGNSTRTYGMSVRCVLQ